MTLPKYKEQLAFTVCCRKKKGAPAKVFKIYVNGAIDGFPEGEVVSICNSIPIFIHEAYVRGLNAALNKAMIDRWEENLHKQKASLPDSSPIDE